MIDKECEESFEHLKDIFGRVSDRLEKIKLYKMQQIEKINESFEAVLKQLVDKKSQLITRVHNIVEEEEKYLKGEQEFLQKRHHYGLKMQKEIQLLVALINENDNQDFEVLRNFEDIQVKEEQYNSQFSKKEVLSRKVKYLDQEMLFKDFSKNLDKAFKTNSAADHSDDNI
mmetsp:Transcript_28358/g.27305  ORF Transcript_28358/g.27305 Transcript_28358/m.27305 type:complete len:171 (-) Transcript_28358:1359-1871(-)|eukprot:CAMPEP_0170559636 /NCGR_PEP_ID=MMETSP0211-20121228/44136_1 /TAXON_ID=311385 /ORGANISM="Pseudokeronopsis sp., Strain OXSARD2" /LENGTH=170 /DNA_ID=CAMNT_0010872907 /DNA_START=590 /DNA_END=1102 /DNA_ORIENTATION=-